MSALGLASLHGEMSHVTDRVRNSHPYDSKPHHPVVTKNHRFSMGRREPDIFLNGAVNYSSSGPRTSYRCRCRTLGSRGSCLCLRPCAWQKVAASQSPFHCQMSQKDCSILYRTRLTKVAHESRSSPALCHVHLKRTSVVRNCPVEVPEAVISRAAVEERVGIPRVDCQHCRVRIERCRPAFASRTRKPGRLSPNCQDRRTAFEECAALIATGEIAVQSLLLLVFLMATIFQSFTCREVLNCALEFAHLVEAAANGSASESVS
jgi:hypothetical protein